MAIRQATCRLLDWSIRRRLAPFARDDWTASAVIIAPHPDDETLGCGGVACKKIANGAEVRFVFVTDGATSHAAQVGSAALRRIRAQEAIDATGRLGADPDRVAFLDFPDGQASAHVPEIARRLITLSGATKTFNLAGTHVGGAIISDPEIRKRFRAMAARSGLLSFSTLGMIATETAQRHGDAWLDALLPYLEANRDYLAAEIVKAVPGARPMHLEATYLAWIDFSAIGMPRKDFMAAIRDRARLGVSPGPQFGPGGEDWIRVNFATPRSNLELAITRLSETFC